MLEAKSYALYKSLFKLDKKRNFNKNNSNNAINNNIFQSYSISNSNNNNINSKNKNKNLPLLKTRKNLLSNLKRSRSYKHSIDYKFYKSLKNGSLTPNNNDDKKNIRFPQVDNSCFNFCINEEDESVKRVKKINAGNKKHKILSELAYKKEIKKRKKNKKFFNDMKLARINFQLAKKKDIEDKKITNEINYKKRILKIKKTNFEHPKTYKDIYHDNYGEIFSNKKFIDKEKKFILKKEKLMKRFHEIMNKINSETQN